MIFSGVYTALITPFNANGQLDEEGLRANVRYQVQAGVSGIVPLGTTGESPTLSEEEEKQIVGICVEEAKGKVQIVVGTGSNSTQKSIEKSQKAQDWGADAVMVVTPYYNKPTQEGLYQHYWNILESISIPLLVYNIPGRTSVLLEGPTLQRLARHSRCKGVKEATGSLQSMSDCIQHISKVQSEFAVLSGDDILTLPLMGLGGSGVVSVVSNLLPEMLVGMVQAAKAGQWKEAERRHYQLANLFKVAFVETNPAPIKYAMACLGIASGSLRLPLVEVSDASKKKIDLVLEELGLV